MKNRSGFLALGIAFVVFSVIVFVLPVEKNAIFWTAYVFDVIAFGLQIPIWNQALGKPDLKSKFYGYPILRIGIVYLIAQVVVSLIVMLVPGIPAWIVVIIEVLLLGATGVGLISGNTARETIAKTEQHVKEKVSFLKLLQVDVETLAAQEPDPTAKAALEALAEAVRFSDPMSSEALAPLEAQISEQVSGLAHRTGDKAKAVAEIQLLLEQRNRKCKALK